MVEKQENEEPLDPAVEAIRVKLVRLLMFSGGLMMLGLMAVIAAIVYKVNQDGEEQVAAGTPTPAGRIAIPKGSNIISTSSDGTGLLLTIKREDGQTVIQRHNSAGQLLSTFTVIEQ